MIARADLRSVVAVVQLETWKSRVTTLWAVPVHRGLYDAAWAADEEASYRAAPGRERRELSLYLSGNQPPIANFVTARQFLDQCPAAISRVWQRMPATSVSASMRSLRLGEIASTIASLKLEQPL